HPVTASKLGHVRGVICLLCAQKKIELIEYSVKRIRKALIGNGGATKLQVRQTVARMLRIDETKLTLDASDALALALGHLGMQQSYRI
ncbi:MAG TPA: crossover junction endodeoxyribonuclease RuvC, partial [Candidatus Omnitrophota bacterium]|nr:crossover junction endodeoxyribonuclease RuvC [Candidatus Omnitrophota bacterium]